MPEHRLRLDPDVAATRSAVRTHLSALPTGKPVVVALSGGPDSLALLAATVHESRDRRVAAVVVDHGLQPESGEVAARAATQARALGASAEVVVVEVGKGGGPEGAARVARYTALERAAGALVAAGVLLGHTRDDQAESVLLGLARGSGPRSLAGMRPVDRLWHRPFLDLTREQTQAACRALQLEWWSDPHNADPRFTRARVRTRVLPVLEEQLGPGVRDALARTADLARDDADLLDGLAADLAPSLSTPEGLSVSGLADTAPALRTRVLRWAIVAAGSPPGELTSSHVRAVERLVTHWHGQQGIDLPGHLRAVRTGSVLRFAEHRVAG